MSQVNQATATENTDTTATTVVEAPKKAKKVKAEKPAPAPKAPSKADISREIMTRLHAEGKSYEDIIAEMIRVNGYDRQLARGTYKANFAKANVPAPVEGVRGAKKKATVTVDTPAADAVAPAAAEQTAEPAPL